MILAPIQFRPVFSEIIFINIKKKLFLVDQGRKNDVEKRNFFYLFILFMQLRDNFN